jgi:GNAT superfamily N-acetyltransferase
MQIQEVLTREQRKEFVNFPKWLYRDDPFWICPLDSGVEGVFDPRINHTFRNGQAVRWLLKDSDGRTIGRIAAFIDNVRSAAHNQPTGGIGFFEVIESQEAAFMLFSTAIGWLKERGMEAVDGPVNFGENDNYWGLLVDGFMQQGFGMPYNKKYYRSYFEEYGFRKYFEQYSYHRKVREEDGTIVQFPERIMKIAGWLAKRQGFSFRHLEIRNLARYINDIVEIYNSTWSVFKDDFTPMEKNILYESFEKARPVIDEELIWFAYHNEKPISFFVLLPDLNQILKHLDGRMHVWNMLKFLYYRQKHEMTRMRAVVGGVHPSFQNSGVESAIFYHLYEVFKTKPWFRELELSWVGDYNPKMMAIYEALGAVRAKTHMTLRYMINDTLTFKTYSEEMHEKGKL